MTEDEAKQRWCPFVRLAKADGQAVPHNQAVFNRIDRGPENWAMPGWPRAACCMASDCMAWRWLYERQIVPADDPRAESRIEPVKTDRGYCGLAGQP